MAIGCLGMDCRGERFFVLSLVLSHSSVFFKALIEPFFAFLNLVLSNILFFLYWLVVSRESKE